MAKKTAQKEAPLPEGLRKAMRALDNQIARSMQRAPDQQEAHGVQKWEPFQKKIEEVTALTLQMFGEDIVQLDSLLVLAQSFSKSLYLVIEELEEEGLGNVRSGYCRVAVEAIARDVTRAMEALQQERSQLM